MATTHINGHGGLSLNDYDISLPGSADAAGPKRTNALSNKLTSVLSSSYADSEIRDALRLLDVRGAQNAEDTRLNLKFDAQKQVIDANARIVEDFGKVAKQLQRVGALITILNQTCDDIRSHIQSAKQDTAPMLDEASTLLSRKEETETKQHLLEAFNTHFLISDEDLTTLTSSAEPVNDRYFVVLDQVKQIHKDCEVLLGHENQRLGMELMEQTTRNLDAGYKKLYNWIQREFKGLDLEDPRTSSSIRRSLRALSERPTLFQNCLDFFAEAREITLSEAFQRALTDSTMGATKAIEFSTHDPLRYIGDMLAWVHSTAVSEKEALEGLFISDAEEISRGLKSGQQTEPWARLRRRRSSLKSAASDDDDDDDEAENTRAEEKDSSFDGHAALNSLISRNMASVSQTLQQRISLTIRNLADSLSTYKSYNLLLFYEDIFVKLLGARGTSVPARSHDQPQYRTQSIGSNTLLDTMSELQTQALTGFSESAKEDIAGVSNEPAPDLSPPAILSTNLNLLSSILRLRSVNLTRDEFTNLYHVLISPILALCTEIAESLATSADKPNTTRSRDQQAIASASTSDQDSDSDVQATFESLIYILNYLQPIVNTFISLSKDQSIAEHTAGPLRGAQARIPTIETQLTQLLTDSFLDISSVDFLLSFLTSETNRSVGVADKRKWLLQHLEECSASLDTFLAGAIMDAQEDLGKLSDKDIAKRVISQAVEAFCVEFERVVDELEGLDDDWTKEKGDLSRHQLDNADETKDEGQDNEEALLRELYPRTVDEVKALLS